MPLHLDHIDHLEEMIARLEAQIEEMMTPFRAQRHLLATAPGIGQLDAAGVIREITADLRESSPPTRTWPLGLGHVLVTTNLPGNAAPPGSATATSTCTPSWSSEPGQLCARTANFSLYHWHVMKWGGYRSQIAKKKASRGRPRPALIIWHILAT